MENKNLEQNVISTAFGDLDTNGKMLAYGAAEMTSSVIMMMDLGLAAAEHMGMSGAEVAGMRKDMHEIVSRDVQLMVSALPRDERPEAIKMYAEYLGAMGDRLAEQEEDGDNQEKDGNEQEKDGDNQENDG